MSSITNKRSFIHAANKKRDSESDLEKKNRVKKLLRKHFGLIALGLMGDFVYLRDKKTKYGDSVTVEKGEVIVKLFHDGKGCDCEEFMELGY